MNIAYSRYLQNALEHSTLTDEEKQGAHAFRKFPVNLQAHRAERQGASFPTVMVMRSASTASPTSTSKPSKTMASTLTSWTRFSLTS